jgi:hypothetical protein
MAQEESINKYHFVTGLLLKRTLYIGIGFSASPREGKVSKCATVLHDSRGNKVSWKVFATVQIVWPRTSLDKYNWKIMETF